VHLKIDLLHILLMKILYLLIIIPSFAFAGDVTKNFNLKMEQLSSCKSPTGDFSTTLNANEVKGDFEVSLDIATNCATILKNPKLYVNDYGITIGTDEISESGYYTSCKCRSSYRFSFQFKEFHDYAMKSVFLTVDGAVAAEATIISK
jgi:hypothetical protein